MKSKWVFILTLLATVALAVPGLAQAQNVPPRAEVTLIPAGALVFAEDEDASAPGFGNYHLGGAVAGNFNRFIGVEGEVGTSIGIAQELGFGLPDDVRTPELLTYSGNLVVSAPTGTSVVPYATGGVGALTILDREEIGINETETLLTTNVGGGVKWYPGVWGLRADYRFLAVPSRDEVRTFGFGDKARYGHRVYGALVLNIR
jgi:hypothetical protein